MSIEPLEGKDVITIIGYGSLIYSILDKIQVKFALPILLPIGVAFPFIVLTLFFVHNRRVYLAGKNRFETFTDKDAAMAIEDIRQAQSTIVLTHFTDREPMPKYRKALLERLEDNVSILRILPDSYDDNLPKNAWVKEFRGKAGYEEKYVSIRLAFDLFIFDNEIVRITLPDDHNHTRFNRGIRIKNKEVSGWFRNTIERMLRVNER